MYWGKDKIQKSLVKALNRYEKQDEEEENKPFLFEKVIQKKYSSSLSQQSSETKLTKHKIGLEIALR